MPQIEGGNPAPAGDPSNTGDDAGGDGNEELEGTSPEEVAEILGKTGMKIPAEPTATDEEEGDNPDDADDTTDDVVDDDTTDDAVDDDTAGDDVADDTTDDALVEEEDADLDKVPLNTNTDSDSKYAFEVKDANGTTFKIEPGQSMEEILADFEPVNNGQVIDILNKLQKAEAQQASDEKSEAEQTAKSEHAQRVSEIQSGWAEEVKDLTAQNRLPGGDEGKARADEVYKFMGEENDKRIKAGRPTIGSFEDALDKLELKEQRENKVVQEKKDKDDARKKGALVGGSGAPASTKPPVYRAGSARSASDAIKQMGLLK